MSDFETISVRLPVPVFQWFHDLSTVSGRSIDDVCAVLLAVSIGQHIAMPDSDGE